MQAGTMPTPPPPESGQFPKGKSGNPGGRTPTKWLRELLDAAYDKSDDGRSNREAIGRHLIEVATSWRVQVRGRGETAFEVASAADSLKAAEILYAYDMGRPTESMEVTSPDGSMSPQQMRDRETTAEMRARLQAILDTTRPAAPREQAGASDGPTDGTTKQPGTE
jgi:hypothetical protein